MWSIDSALKNRGALIEHVFSSLFSAEFQVCRSNNVDLYTRCVRETILVKVHKQIIDDMINIIFT